MIVPGLEMLDDLKSHALMRLRALLTQHESVAAGQPIPTQGWDHMGKRMEKGLPG